MTHCRLVYGVSAVPYTLFLKIEKDVWFQSLSVRHDQKTIGYAFIVYIYRYLILKQLNWFLC